MSLDLGQGDGSTMSTDSPLTPCLFSHHVRLHSAGPRVQPGSRVELRAAASAGLGTGHSWAFRPLALVEGGHYAVIEVQ